MTSPVLTRTMTSPGITRSTDHRYTHAGKTYPGVTGILKVIDKSDALMNWAARNTAEAAVAQIGALPSLLDTVGPEGVVKALTSRSSWKRDQAAALGSEVHDLADQWTRGLDPQIPEHARKHVANYAEWWTASGWSLRTSEAMVVHPDAGYGGTLDLLARDRDGRTVLADIKTGKAVYSEAVLQLAAYGMAKLIQPGGASESYPMPVIERHVILHVTADAVREVEVPIGSMELMAFLACIDLSAWHSTTKGKRL